MMNSLALAGVGLLMIAALFSVYRLVRGPDSPNRILAFEGVASCAVALTAGLSFLWADDVYLELILVIGALGFSGAMAFTLYLNRAPAEHGRGVKRDSDAGGPHAGN
jgi:multisubunit Na+/H+ antiporter MnhF subunit